MATLCADWGLDMKMEVVVDATAGKGIAERRGVGRVRHLHAPLLWVQQVVEQRRIALRKIQGENNLGDLPTKHVDAKTLWRHMRAMGFEVREGASKIALKAAV